MSIDIWRKYIEAQKAIIAENERPFLIEKVESFGESVFRGKKVFKIRLSQKQFTNFPEILKSAFDDIFYDEYIFEEQCEYDIVSNLLHLPLSFDSSKFNKLLGRVFRDFSNSINKSLFEEEVLQSKNTPCIAGDVNLKGYKVDTSLPGIVPGENFVHMTLKEIEHLDRKIETNKFLLRSNRIGAILKLNSIDVSEIMSKVLGKEVKATYLIKNQEINVESKFIELNFDFRVDSITNYLNFKDEVYSNFEVWNDSSTQEKFVIRFKRGSTKHFHDRWDELKSKYQNGKLIYFNFKIEITEEDAFKSYLYDLFYSKLNSDIGTSIYFLDKKLQKLSFDFEDQNDLFLKIAEFKKIIPCNTFFDYHGADVTKFKVYVNFQLPTLNNLLNEINEKFEGRVITELDKVSSSFKFYFFYLNDNDRVSFQNWLNQLATTINIKYFTKTIAYKSFYIKYNNEAYTRYIKDKISSLNGVDIHMPIENSKRSKILGQLAAKESNTYSLTIINPLISQTDDNSIYLNSLLSSFTVKPDLQGDKKKVSYLEEAINKVTSPGQGFNAALVNKNLGEFLFNSSLAEQTEEELVKPSSILYQRIKENLFSKSINEPQIESVVKAVASKDLALLQGPPGTGKTTVIAELLWQIIQQDPKHKILLTSESNLAVDNALDRLRGTNQFIVKPIRLGKNVSEEEGFFYHIDRINSWSSQDHNENKVYNENLDDVEDLNNNIVFSWMKNQASNVEANPDLDDIVNEWKASLLEPSSELKENYKEAYYNNTNVVGNTCSSAGSDNFLQAYQDLFNKKDIAFQSKDKIVRRSEVIGYYLFLKRNNMPRYKEVETKLEPIVFDTIIMDEASKATPPEMLLPLSFGKRSIIIGDHRQLPPTLKELDDEGFLKTLEKIGAKYLAEDWETREELKTSHFKSLIVNNGIETIRGIFNLQYRMHPQINNVIKQFYIEDGGLEPGEELLKNCELHYSTNHPLSRYHGFNLKGFINPSIHTLWIDVDEPEYKDGFSYINFGEVKAIDTVLTLLKHSDGFSEYAEHWNECKKAEENEIGIISFYAKQLGELRKIQNRHSDLNIRLKTVDRFQGMERNIIIVSTVRSNKKMNDPHQIPNLSVYPENGGYPVNHSFGFAEAPERINVAFSRAKRLLIIVGNRAHFSTNNLYKEVIETIGNISPGSQTIINYKDLPAI